MGIRTGDSLDNAELCVYRNCVSCQCVVPLPFCLQISQHHTVISLHFGELHMRELYRPAATEFYLSRHTQVYSACASNLWDLLFDCHGNSYTRVLLKKSPHRIALPHAGSRRKSMKTNENSALPPPNR